jgi:hypothetical protein
MKNWDLLDRAVMLALLENGEWMKQVDITRAVHGFDKKENYHLVNKSNMVIAYRLMQMMGEGLVERDLKTKKYRIMNAVLTKATLVIDKVLTATEDAEPMDESLPLGRCLIFPFEGKHGILFIDADEVM